MPVPASVPGWKDADPERIRILLGELSAEIRPGNISAAAQVCERILIEIMGQWNREEELLARTRWSRTIVACHIDDHERIEAVLTAMMAHLHRGQELHPWQVSLLGDLVTEHIAAFDQPAMEQMRRLHGHHS